ncbi:uncharacterized protein IWZ02DRAFT_238701 [Phyllosticta citriasiana]|uniref:uncharacterized protein n=1 Tax=Phyllosticta citriasiana TaxID=595635 RepID=UPI0030FDB432
MSKLSIPVGLSKFELLLLPLLPLVLVLVHSRLLELPQEMASPAWSRTSWCHDPRLNHCDPAPTTKNTLMSSALCLLVIANLLAPVSASFFQLPFFNNPIPSIGENTTAMSVQKYSLPKLPYPYDVSTFTPYCHPQSRQVW